MHRYALVLAALVLANPSAFAARNCFYGIHEMQARVKGGKCTGAHMKDDDYSIQIFAANGATSNEQSPQSNSIKGVPLNKLCKNDWTTVASLAGMQGQADVPVRQVWSDEKNLQIKTTVFVIDGEKIKRDNHVAISNYGKITVPIDSIDWSFSSPFDGKNPIEGYTYMTVPAGKYNEQPIETRVRLVKECKTAVTQASQQAQVDAKVTGALEGVKNAMKNLQAPSNAEASAASDATRSGRSPAIGGSAPAGKSQDVGNSN